jgi:uncharacterized protein YbcI
MRTPAGGCANDTSAPVGESRACKNWIVHEYTGRGPTKARTSIRDDIVVVMLQETLLKAEQSLIRDEKDRVVVEMRRTFQQTMREDLSAAIEMLTERKVIAFMSDSHLDPDYSVELFVLAPLEES